MSLMARFLAAGLAHNWFPHYAPSLGVIFIFSACLDRDFIGKLRFCGVTTAWQSISGALVECMYKAKVQATSPNYCCLSRIILCTAILCPHSRRPFLSLRPLQDLFSQAKRFFFFSNIAVSVLVYLRWVGMYFAPFRCFIGFLGSVLLVSAFSLKTYLRGTLVKQLCPHSLFWRWSRSRHKRLRGIGSQAASRRARSRRVALAFKARSISGLTLHSHWKIFLRFLFVRDRMPRRRPAVWQTICVVLALAVAYFAVWGSLHPFQPWCGIGAMRDNIEAATEVFISLWSSPSVVSLSQFPLTIAAPFPRICLWGLLSLCSSLYAFSFRHVLGACCLSVVPRVVRRFRIVHFPRLGATIALIVILWQISFLGIRVGEASNPGPAMSKSVPVSDGVTTPLPQLQDQDLEISVPGVVFRPPGSPSLVSPSLSLATAAPPYDPAPPLPQSPFVRPSRFCSFPRPGSAARRSPSHARTAPHRSRSPPSGFRFVCCRSVIVSPSCPHPCEALLSGPFLSRSCSLLSRLTGGPLSARCARTSMLILLDSSLVTFPWIGFVVWGSALARFARGF